MSKGREPFETIQYPTVLIIGVQAPYNTTKNIDSYYEEFKSLIAGNGIAYEAEIYVKLRLIDAAYFFTKGKLEQIARICEEKGIEEVIISEPLSGKQERNVSKALDTRVFDRTQLILEIFDRGATTAAGKLQVELAMLKHRKSRLAGHGASMARQSGRSGSGSRGPGETQKEQDIRYINQRITKIKRELQKLEKTRGIQRKQRLSSNLPQISLIGYTNAGKSSLLNALTHNTALAEDRLFATLDTTTREFYIDGEKQALLSDTVGFIQQLPHTLIEAFKSTLRELAYADLLVHVVDISDPNWRLHITVVHDVLDELEVDKPVLYVFNKADLIESKALIESALEPYEPHLIISTQNQDDIQHLVHYLRNWTQNAHA